MPKVLQKKAHFLRFHTLISFINVTCCMTVVKESQKMTGNGSCYCAGSFSYSFCCFWYFAIFSQSCCSQLDQLLAWYCHLSVHPSVTLYIVVPGVGVGGWKLYRRLPWRALHIHFSMHFCCRIYHLSTKDSECQHLVKKLTGNTVIGYSANRDQKQTLVWNYK